MKASAKTIQIFLPSGDPQGIRVAEITTRIMQLIEVLRSLLQEFFSMAESEQVAVYFLVGEADDTEQKVYIGQTGDLRARLAKHNKVQDFWERALVAISRTNNLTQTHGLFLEWHSIQQCRAAGRYTDLNGNSGSKPHTPAPLEADCLEMFDTATTLLATLGYPLFAPLLDKEQNESDVFYCTTSGANGSGVFTSEGFVVLKGSVGRVANVPSFASHSYAAMKDELIQNGTCKVVGDTIVFQKDHLFKKPSQACAALQGRAGNGWIEWKNKTGKTLDQMKRSVEPT